MIANILMNKAKTMNSKITLICTPMRFYSHNDEELLFAWINKIPSISHVEGIGRELHMHIISNTIPNNELRDLIGIFQRYKFDKKQLKVFMNESNKKWFK